MKTHTIKTPTAELLIVQLPEGTISYQYSSNLEIISAEVPNDKGVSFEQSRIKKGYTLLGKPDEIKERDAILLVSISYDFWNYKDYSNSNNSFKTATESLLSAIETEIFWENPYDEYRLTMTFANEYKNRWEKAQEKTFDRNRSIILVKN